MQAVDPRSFEVFISYKNSGQDGERTRDAELAFALHEQLQAQGIKSFCSTLSLAKMGQGAYKDAINQALDAARVMVVVGTSTDHIMSPWVKYEWGSFHDDLLTGRKQGGTLCSFIAGMNPNDLPRELRGYESFLLEQNGEELIVEFIQAALENKVELGYAGTKPTSGRYQVIGPADAALPHGLAALLEDLLHLHVVEELPVALLVALSQRVPLPPFLYTGHRKPGFSLHSVRTDA